MENLTHTLVGLAMSRCGLGTWAWDRGEKHAALMIMLAANAPDIDAYPFFTNQVDYIDIHRGYPHALVLAPLVALLPIVLVSAVRRQFPVGWGMRLWLWLSCTLGVLSHVVLDWTNVYGTRMLLPFSAVPLHLDITDIVDPFIWLILFVCLGVPSVLALVGSEIGSRKSTGGKRAWAFLALLGLFGYEVARWDSHARAVASLNALLYMDEPAKNVYAFPNGFGTLRWRGVVEGETFYYEVPVSPSGEFNMRNASLAYKAGKTKAGDAARTTHTFQVFEEFDQVPLWRVSPIGDETQVDLYDLRFGSLSRPGLKATAVVEPDGRVENVRFGFFR